MERKPNPISVGNPNLREMLENGNLYIDKTKYIYNLISNKSVDNIFFLSRPRRFGKSLTVDTLEQIFKGNKELFKGLYTYDKYDFEEYPVIKLSMNIVPTYDLGEFLYSLRNDVLMPVAREYGIEDGFPAEGASPSSWLRYLIDRLSWKYGKKVVVLIDEFDYPLLDSLNNDIYNDIKVRIDSFYGVLKPSLDSIRFCFITGITRFQHVSIFSKLNNLIDISSSPEYAALCGYTDEELDYYFAPYIQKYYEDNNLVEQEEMEAFRKSIKDYYDGYCFSDDLKTTIYNPVSVGMFFNGGCSFRNFWINTGFQTIVNDVVKRHPEFFSSDSMIEIGRNSMASLEVKNLQMDDVTAFDVYSYLVQAGYLTIKGISGGRYVLGYPNLEVKDTMETALLSSSYGLGIYSDDFGELRRCFSTGETSKIIETFQKFYVRFPYDMSLEKERGYQIAFVAVLKALSFERVDAEEKTNIGRMDISVKVKDDLYYIIELKLDESAEKALKQIKEKRYYEKYEKKGNTIHLLGINFSSKERNIRDWKEEVVRK